MNRIIEIFGTPGSGKTYIEEQIKLYCQNNNYKFFSTGIYYNEIVAKNIFKKISFFLLNLHVLVNPHMISLVKYVDFSLKSSRSKKVLAHIKRQVILNVLLTKKAIKMSKNGYLSIINEGFVTQYGLRFSNIDPTLGNIGHFFKRIHKIDQNLLFRGKYIYVIRDYEELYKTRIEREKNNINKKGEAYVKQIKFDIDRINAAYELMYKKLKSNSNEVIIFDNNKKYDYNTVERLIKRIL